MSPAPEQKLGSIEFTAVLAAAMSMAALGIDLLLPAFPAIRTDLGLSADSTAVAGLITAYFVGIAVGQPLWGPASDSFGRLPILRAGFAVYILGGVLSIFSPTLALLLPARFVMGLGAAAARVVTIAMVRDRYEGEQMSKQMSLILSVFMIVPVFAPAIGAAGVAVAPWRWLLVACVVAAALTALWTTRMAESLAPESRRELRFKPVMAAARTVLRSRVTVGNMIAMTALYGGLTTYLGTSELIFGEVFQSPELFPVLFGALAVVMAGGMLTNARIVERVGSRPVAHIGLIVYIVAAAALLLVGLMSASTPPLWVYMSLMAVILLCFAVSVPNLNSIAMEPMGAVAGMASAVIGAVQVGVGALIGAGVDQLYDGTIVPIAASTLVFGILGVASISIAERRTLTVRPANRPKRVAATAT